MPEGKGHAKLKTLTNLREVLTVATEFERTARDFYTALAPKVSKSIRYLVEELVAEEQQHLDLFAGLAGRADVEAVLETEIERPASDRKFSDCIHLPDLGDNPDDQAVLQYALAREHAAMEQYTALAEATPPGALRNVFVFLANEETKHKNELEAVYYRVVHSGGV
ncbi:ferritin family protein [Pinisolibacter sp.]|uniref:ferritin family protein n=1 Tax=Pinisolibacter sp. TaxID=2172024 RepID=UPI002FDDF130